MKELSNFFWDVGSLAFGFFFACLGWALALSALVVVGTGILSVILTTWQKLDALRRRRKTRHNN